MRDSKVLHIRIEEDELDALADANCWLAGFVAGGGHYNPGTTDTLRQLQIKLREGWAADEDEEATK